MENKPTAPPPFGEAFLWRPSCPEGIGLPLALSALSVALWTASLFLTAYVVSIGPLTHTPSVWLGYDVLLQGLLSPLVLLGSPFLPPAPLAVPANWIIVRGLSNFKKTHAKPVVSMARFWFVHLSLLALSLSALAPTNLTVGPSVYIWFASLLIMTSANYCAYCRQHAAQSKALGKASATARIYLEHLASSAREEDGGTGLLARETSYAGILRQSLDETGEAALVSLMELNAHPHAPSHHSKVLASLLLCIGDRRFASALAQVSGPSRGEVIYSIESAEPGLLLFFPQTAKFETAA
jgi:hypothetical protein